MKCNVFGDGLLCMAFARPGKIQHGTVDRLPLFLQTEAVVPRATTIPAVLPIRWPRQSDVDLRTAKPRMTTPTETEARPRAGCQAAMTTGVSCRRRRTWNFKAPIQRTIHSQPIERQSQQRPFTTRANLFHRYPAEPPPRDTGGYVSSLWTFEISCPAGLSRLRPTSF